MKIEEQQLRARFNPEGSLLRRHQLRMLELLLEVDAICRHHGIRYWLSSGTLIGAARHRGFIPWDDDVDIEMLEPDYRKLLRVLPKELPPTMALQSMSTDKNYFFFYAKLRDRRSHLDEGHNYDKLCAEQGIYIDIFHFYRQPLWIHKLSELLEGHAYKICRTGGQWWKVRAITTFNRRLTFPMLRLLCRCTRAPLRHALGTPYDKPRFLEDIFPLQEMDFEGHRLPVPAHTDRMLTRLYGNWRQLPDLKDIRPHTAHLDIAD